jgi:hypothetical protein
MGEHRSLGYLTDRFFVELDGEVRERDRYVVFRTPKNPDFYWGNILLYPDPPTVDASRRGHAGSWLDDLDRELPGAPAAVLAWDRPDGARGVVEPFVELGFEIDEGCILTADRVSRSTRHDTALEARRVQTDAAWAEATRVLVDAYTERRSGSVADLTRFVVTQMARYRQMQEGGLGVWYGGYRDGEMAATLGVFRQGELGRFQLVGTSPRHGRRGACSTLVHDVSRMWLDGDVPGVLTRGAGVRTLVMAADATYHAARVYESVGFRATERLVALVKHAPRV